MANGLACHEHLPILVTRFFVPAAEEGERSGFYKYAMRTTIDFPIINFALRCGGKRPVKRSLYRHVAMLLDLRK